MRRLSLDEIRQIQLEILISVDAFCREKGIRYSLAYGTLIGAVRHRGFIPWDDDIDIMMPRPDYERFLKEFEGKCRNLSIKNYRNDDITAITWTEIIDTRTVMLASNMQTSIFIDVFPIDGAPEDGKVDRHIKETYKRRYYVVRKRKSYKYGKHKWKRYLKYVGKQILYPKSRNRAIREYEEYVLSFPFDTSPNAGMSWARIIREEVMPAEVFKTYRTIEFEGHTFMCISDYDTFLKRRYGDYMTLPPENERVRGHDYAAYWKEENS